MKTRSIIIKDIEVQIFEPMYFQTVYNDSSLFKYDFSLKNRLFSTALYQRGDFNRKDINQRFIVALGGSTTHGMLMEKNQSYPFY